jgi:hypothetical protein
MGMKIDRKAISKCYGSSKRNELRKILRKEKNKFSNGGIKRLKFIRTFWMTIEKMRLE